MLSYANFHFYKKNYILSKIIKIKGAVRREGVHDWYALYNHENIDVHNDITTHDPSYVRAGKYT